MATIVKIVLAILSIVVISKFIAPLLAGLMAPFGAIALILLYLLVVSWLLGYFPLP